MGNQAAVGRISKADQKPANFTPKTRVFYDHQVFTAQRFGGVSRYFCDLIAHLRMYGVEPDVFFGLNVNDYGKQMSKGFGIGIPPLRRTYRIRKLINQCAQVPYLYFRNPDIVHKTGYCRETIPPGIKVVITVHDMIHEAAPSWEPSVTAAKYFWCKRADHIITISRATCDALMRTYDVPARKVTVIHHGTSALPTPDRAAPVQGEFILYVGTRSRYKNFSTLATAYANAHRVRSRYRLVCFGGGPITTAEAFEFRTLGIQDDVVFLYGSDHLLASCYRHAKALVYPSLQEGFGLPLLEAMALACPIICSSIPPFREVAGQAAVYFDPTSAQAIAEALDQSLHNPGRLADCRADGLERSREFSWDRCAKETAEVYHSLANR